MCVGGMAELDSTVQKVGGDEKFAHKHDYNPKFDPWIWGNFYLRFKEQGGGIKNNCASDIC